MKKPLSHFIVSLAALSAAVPLMAGLRFGMASAVKAQAKALDKKIVSGTFRFVNGASQTTAQAPHTVQRGPYKVPAEGHWYMSPNKVRFQVTEVRFRRPDGGFEKSELKSACGITYDRDLGSRSALLDCPFQVKEGAYIGVGVTVNNNFDVLIEDGVNSIYSDPNSSTKLASALPSGGAKFVSYPVRSGSAGSYSDSYFDNDLNVGSGSPSPLIQILLDGNQTIGVDVDSGGTPSFNTNCITCTDSGTGSGSPPLTIIPFISGAAREFVYGSSSSASVNSFGNSPQLVRVFYETPGGQPSAFSVSGSFPNLCGGAYGGFGTGGAFHAGGGASWQGAYLGRDAGGVIGGATRGTNGAFAALFSFPEVTAIGGATSFKYKCESNPPAPVSGADYSSNVPSFTPEGQVTLTLFLN